MSSCWRRGRGKREEGKGKGIAWVLLFSFSLFPLPSAAGPYADLDARLKGRPDREASAALENRAGDADARAALDRGPKAARAYIGLRASLEGARPSASPSIGAAPGDARIASSWLARALARLRRPHIDAPEFGGGPSVPAVGGWATTVMWGLLAALGALAAYLLVRFVRLPKLRRKPKLVEDEEPERTADEWIREADALVAQGRFREAVRGLYVAGLLRFDEANVARFDRHQTNWEHLRRIEVSPRRPEGLDARDATGRFDRVWYGRLGAAAEDAAAMRAWYEGVAARLREPAGAAA